MAQQKKYDNAQERVEEWRKSKRDTAGIVWQYSGEDFEKVDFWENTPLWLSTYLNESFPVPFGQVHLDIIADYKTALLTGKNMATVAPRGTGKSTLIDGLTVGVAVSLKTALPIAIPYSAEMADKTLEFIKYNLCYNDRLHRDYPEICDLFFMSEGKAIKLDSLTMNGKQTGAKMSMSRGYIIFPDGQHAVGSSSLRGNPRGYYVATITGKRIRPTIAAIDDPQTDESARSPAEVVKTIDKIKTISGMAGSQSKMPIILTGTILRRNDVMSYFLARKDWICRRVGQIETWPTDFHLQVKGEYSDRRKKWETWNQVRIEQGDEKAIEAYNADKEDLTHGMTVTWDHRYDKDRGQPDALYSAMYDYYEMGEATFMAERQNDPLEMNGSIFGLSVETILEKTDKSRNELQIPEWCTFIVACTDVNPSYAYTTVIIACGKGNRKAVIYRARYSVKDNPLMAVKQDMPEPERKRRVYECLVLVGKQIKKLGLNLDSWGVDCGWERDTVMEFCRNSIQTTELKATPLRGCPSKYYRNKAKDSTGVTGEMADERMDKTKVKYIMFDQGYWIEAMQKSFFGSIGANGTLSLYKGDHTEYANQVCNEEVIGSAVMNGIKIVETIAHGQHDYGDATYMCYVMAGFKGYGTIERMEEKKKEIKLFVFK